MQLSERARDLRHRVAEIVGGLTGPQDYELDGAILAAFEELRAAAEAAAYERAAQCVDDMVVVIERERFGAPHDPRDVVALRAASAAIRALT